MFEIIHLAFDAVIIIGVYILVFKPATAKAIETQVNTDVAAVEAAAAPVVAEVEAAV